MFLSYCITYKAISLPLVAAVASAAAVAVASATAAAAAEVGGGGGGGGGGSGGCGGEGGGGGDDLTRLDSEICTFKILYFHNSLEIIFRNFNNSFLTSVISLQAIFRI